MRERYNMVVMPDVVCSLDRLDVASRKEQEPCQVAVDLRQERIERIGLLHFLHRLIGAASHKEQILRITSVGLRRAGVEFERPAELVLGTSPVPIKSKGNIAKRGMGLRKRVIELNGPGSGGLGPGHHLERSSIICAQTGVGISKAGVGQCIVWVVGEGL